MDFIFEVLLEVFGEVYMDLMVLIVPEKFRNKKAEKIVPVIAIILSAVILVGLIISFCAMADGSLIGKYVFFILLGIIIIQIISGIILKAIKKKK